MINRGEEAVMFSLEEIIQATGGALLTPSESSRNMTSSCSGISTDTRSLRPGDLFVALEGDRFDGHAFLATATEKGAGMTLLSRKEDLPAAMTGILVPDTLVALQALARAWRRKLQCRVIAVTGSVGKTSTREMLYYAFSRTLCTHATKHNLNNEIGLPMTILSAPRDTELLILEMGMRKRGEIEALSLVTEPDIAVITNIGVSHIERLGSREEIRDAKLEICSGFRDGGVLLYSGNDSYLNSYFRKDTDQKVFRIGETLDEGTADDLYSDWAVRAKSVQCDHEVTSFVVEARKPGETQLHQMDKISIPAVGLHHVKNAMFAILAALVLDVSVSSVAHGLSDYHPAGSRSKMIRTRDYLLIDDTYNASPESMEAAFSSLNLVASKENRRSIAALGCVLELGSYAQALHLSIGQAAARAGIDRLYLCGDHAQSMQAGARMIRPDIAVSIFPSREKLTAALLQEMKPGDAILAKGSHAFAMEKVIEAILGTIEENDAPEGEA